MAYVRVQRDSCARDGNTDEQISWASEAGSRSVRCHTETECEDLVRRDEEEKKGERKPRVRELKRSVDYKYIHNIKSSYNCDIPRQ